MDLKSFIRDIPDWPKPGILFRDITPLLGSPTAYARAVQQLVDLIKPLQPDALAAAEARGFLFASPAALIMSRAFVPLRKPGKLPFTTRRERYELEYGTAQLEVHTDAIQPGARVVLVDDLLATGGTMAAAAKLVEGLGGKVAGYAFLIELQALRGREILGGQPVVSVLSYP